MPSTNQTAKAPPRSSKRAREALEGEGASEARSFRLKAFTVPVYESTTDEAVGLNSGALLQQLLGPLDTGLFKKVSRQGTPSFIILFLQFTCSITHLYVASVHSTRHIYHITLTRWVRYQTALAPV